MSGFLVSWLLAASLSVIIKGQKPVYTFVTSISNRTDDAQKEMMLNSTQNMIIFGPQHLRSLILERRPTNLTVFISKDIQIAGQQQYFSNINNKHSNIEKTLLKEHQQSQFKTILMTKAKLFLMAQAQKYDKFNSQFLIWIDSKELHQISERVLKLFYELVQPRWLFFTKYSKSEAQIAPSFGEEKYINRRLKVYEQVNPSFMGGSVEILKDIKNAYESFLRVLFEEKINHFERNALSLMPIRFPSLVPYTVSFKLDDINSKVRKYSDNYRLTRYPRSFSGYFDSNGQLAIKDTNFTTFFEMSSNYEDKEILSELKMDYYKIHTKKAKLIHLLAVSNHFYQITANFIDLFIFLILLAGYIVIAKKNEKTENEMKDAFLYNSQSSNKNREQMKVFSKYQQLMFIPTQ